MIAILLAGCNSQHGPPKPSLQITRVPPGDPGGPMQLDYIEGRVSGASPGQQIVLYAHGGPWWVQPFKSQPLTRIQADSTWRNSTHLGVEYAALLVESNYRPEAKLDTLPNVGNGVVAVATVKGSAAKPIVIKTIHFSGYDWNVRAAGSARGGEANFYDPANAWTDKDGYLHLTMSMRDGKWTCAEVALTRGLGYGSYRFVVQDSAHLDPSAVLVLFTFDEEAGEETRKELDVELSRWGNPTNKNAQYVVQPYYVPENVARFSVPAGVLTHIIRWEPGVASFSTIPGSVVQNKVKNVSEHVFNSGIPIPALEKVHIDLYDFHHSRNTSQRPAEVVIEKFEYLP